MRGSYLEPISRGCEMASLGFVRLMQDREGSGVLASAATLLVVHSGVRLTSSNSGFVGMVCVSNHPF